MPRTRGRGVGDLVGGPRLLVSPTLLIMDDGSHVMYQGVVAAGWEEYIPQVGDHLMTVWPKAGLSEVVERTVVEVPELWPDG